MPDYTIPGLDDTVALGVKPIVMTPPNPIEQLQGLTDVQQRMNAVKLFNEQMKARQQAGDIMAASPDMDTAFHSLSVNPQVMGYMPDILNTLRQADLTNQQLQGVKQTQGDTAIHSIMQTIPSAMTDMGSFDKMIGSRLAAMPEGIRNQVAPSVAYIKSALFDGLPSDPAAATAAYRQRWNAMMIGGGFSPDQIAGMTGTAKIQDMGGYNQPVVQLPGALGGTVIPVGGAMGKTLAPQIISGPQGPENQPVTRAVGGGIPSNAITGPAIVQTPRGPQIDGVQFPPESRAGGGGNLLTGATQTQSQYNTKRTDDIADYEKNLDDRVANGGVLRQNVQAVVNAAKQAEVGPGAPTYLKLAQALKAIGVNNSVTDKLANGSVPALQEADKVSLQNSMAQLKQQLTGVGGSRLNAQEFVAYMNKNPNIATDPRAMVDIFNLWQKFYDRDKAEQTAFDKFKSGELTGDKNIDKPSRDKDIKNWPAIWNNSSYMSNFAPGGPIDTRGVKGLPNSGFSQKDRDLIQRYLRGAGQ